MVCIYEFPTAAPRPWTNFFSRPNINITDQDTVLDLLCRYFTFTHAIILLFSSLTILSLLAPIGQHRNLYTQPLKGKRSRKRKRVPPIDNAISIIQPPSPPELNLFLTIGLNSTTRHLESMAAVLPAENTPSKPRLLAVFVCRSDSQPSQLHSHLPVLCNIASRSSPEHIVKLVQLPRGAEARLTASLAIPRVGFLGLMEGAPGSTSLLHFLEEKVPGIKVPWLEGGFQPTAIRAMKTIAPTPTKKKIVRVDRTEKVG